MLKNFRFRNLALIGWILATPGMGWAGDTKSWLNSEGYSESGSSSCDYTDALLHPCDPPDDYFGFVLSGESAVSELDGRQRRIDGLGLSLLLNHRTTLGWAFYRLGSPLTDALSDHNRRLSLHYSGFELSTLGDWQGLFTPAMAHRITLVPTYPT